MKKEALVITFGLMITVIILLFTLKITGFAVSSSRYNIICVYNGTLNEGPNKTETNAFEKASLNLYNEKTLKYRYKKPKEDVCVKKKVGKNYSYFVREIYCIKNKKSGVRRDSINSKSSKELIKCEEGCEDGACVETKENECSQKGLRWCEDNGYYICDDYNSDGFLENGMKTNCAEGETCIGGVCGKISNNSCFRKDFNMAFVLLARNISEFNNTQIMKLNSIKKYFSEDFKLATNNLSSMNTSYQLVLLVDNGSLISWDGRVNVIQVASEFYKNNSDIFDFISIYAAYSPPGGFGSQYHMILKNDILGIGNDNLMDGSLWYLNKTRLLGINFLGDINMYSPPELDVSRSNGLLHETGHQWCCYVGDNFAGGGVGKLEIIQQNIHFYRGLQSPFETGDSMNSDNWVSNNDGTFRRENKMGTRKYHPFVLYFMGLLPKREYARNFTLYNAGIVGQNFNDKNAIFYKNISINDIIAVLGERGCS